MIQVFIRSFVLVALYFAFMGAFTKFLYKYKSPEDLNPMEMLILNGNVSIGNRFAYFFTLLFKSIISPKVYVLAALCTALFGITN